MICRMKKKNISIMGFAYFQISRAFSGIIRDFLTHKTGFSDTQNWIFEPRAPQISTSTSISTCKITTNVFFKEVAWIT